MSSFTVDISKFVEKAKVSPAAATKKAFFEISNRIVMRTPVLDGFLRSNWLPGINSPTVQRLNEADQSGNRAIGRISETITKKTSGDFTLYLNNSLPYARRIEFEGWSSVKAPQGMVRVSIAEFQNELEKAARSLNR